MRVSLFYIDIIPILWSFYSILVYMSDVISVNAVSFLPQMSLPMRGAGGMFSSQCKVGGGGFASEHSCQTNRDKCIKLPLAQPGSQLVSCRALAVMGHLYAADPVRVQCHTSEMRPANAEPKLSSHVQAQCTQTQAAPTLAKTVPLNFIVCPFVFFSFSFFNFFFILLFFLLGRNMYLKCP